MTYPNDRSSGGIKVDDHKDTEQDRTKEIEALKDEVIIDLPRNKILELEAEVKKKDERIAQLTAMCYTLARRIRNEAFSDNITSVQRQQLAEMAMNSLVMTPQVWELVHRSEEAQQQNSS